MGLFEDFKNAVREGSRLLANLTLIGSEKAGEAVRAVAQKTADAVRAYFRQVRQWSIRLFIAALAPLLVIVPCFALHAPWGWLYGTYVVYLVLLLAAELVLLVPVLLAWKRVKAIPILGPDLQEQIDFIKNVVFNGLSLGIFVTLFPVWRSPGAFPLLLLVLACWLTLPGCKFSAFCRRIYPAVRAVQLLILAALLILQMAFPRQLEQLKWVMGRKVGNVLTSGVGQTDVTGQWKSLTWFNNVGEPLVWHSGSEAEGFRLWAAPGFDPDSGKELQPVSDERVRARIVGSLDEQDRRERERLAAEQAEQARKAAALRQQEEKQAARERERIAAEQAEQARRAEEQRQQEQLRAEAQKQAEAAKKATETAERARLEAAQRQQDEERAVREKEAAAKKAAELAAAERARYLARYTVPNQLRNQSNSWEVAVLVATESRTPNAAIGNAVVAALRAKAANASASVFTPEFIADGLFDKAFGGAQGTLNRLELTNSADLMLLARQSVQYSTNLALEGLITASMNLEISVLSAATEQRLQTHVATASGAGFTQADARALAEDRLFKQMAGPYFEPFWKALLNKPH